MGSVQIFPANHRNSAAMQARWQRAAPTRRGNGDAINWKLKYYLKYRAVLQVILQLPVYRVTVSPPSGSRTLPPGLHGRTISMIGRENLNRSHGSMRKSFAILCGTSALRDRKSVV